MIKIIIQSLQNSIGYIMMIFALIVLSLLLIHNFGYLWISSFDKGFYYPRNTSAIVFDFLIFASLLITSIGIIVKSRWLSFMSTIIIFFLMIISFSFLVFQGTYGSLSSKETKWVGVFLLGASAPFSILTWKYINQRKQMQAFDKIKTLGIQLISSCALFIIWIWVNSY